MPTDRYHHQHLQALGSGAEAIMPSSSGSETNIAADLTVTAGGALFIAVLVLPVILIAGAGDPLTVTALAMAISATGRTSELVYRRLRRN